MRKMKMRARAVPGLLAVGLLTAISACASDPGIADRLAGVSRSDIGTTPLPGLFEVAVGGHVVYVSRDGRYLLKGDLIDIATNQSLTQDRRMELRRELLSEIGPERLVTYSVDDPEIRVIAVVDPTCPHCRRLHADAGRFKARRIELSYLLLPTGAPGSESWNLSERIWCAADRKAALDIVMGDEDTAGLQACQSDTPMQDNRDLAEMLGVTGTPMFFLENGREISGYLSVEEVSRVARSLSR